MQKNLRIVWQQRNLIHKSWQSHIDHYISRTPPYPLDFSLTNAMPNRRLEDPQAGQSEPNVQIKNGKKEKKS
jgi:hypothetical protein